MKKNCNLCLHVFLRRITVIYSFECFAFGDIERITRTLNIHAITILLLFSIFYPALFLMRVTLDVSFLLEIMNYEKYDLIFILIIINYWYLYSDFLMVLIVKPKNHCLIYNLTLFYLELE